MNLKSIPTVAILIFTVAWVSIPSNATSKVKTEGIYVNTPTQSQVIQFVKNHPILTGGGGKVTYDIVPSVKKPFSAGKVSAKYLNDGLNAVNIMRYIAGIPSNIKLDDEYNSYAQAGAVINSANNLLEHRPEKPAGMDDDFYDTGYTGTSSGNISWGNSLISETVVSGYMDDGDPSNISRIGHRRWVLNPPMESTGFGYTPSKYSVMYAFDNFDGYVEDKYSITAWPAQNTPIEYFDSGYPFSLSLSSDFDNVDRNKIKIRLTRISDGKVFNFNSKSSKKENSKSYFNVNNEGYGQPHCVIWRPDVAGYKNGEIYSVEISGITKGGASYPVSYNVSFFSLSNKITEGKAPVISKLALGLSKMNPNKDILKISISTDSECLLYCKVYDKNNNKVVTIANGTKLNKAGNWYVNWNGQDGNKKILKLGVYRIDAYLGNSGGYSKTLSKTIQIVEGSAPVISNVKLSSDYFSPGNENLSIIFSSDSECLVYCNVYDSDNIKIACIANGAKVNSAGRWTLSWNGVDSSGYYVNPGQYRIEIIPSTKNGTGNKVNSYVQIY